MVETIILEYLGTALNVPAYMEVPENPPEEYVVIEKTSSRMTNQLKGATLALQSIAPSLYEAALLNETVKTAMNSAVALPAIARCHLETDYNFTNTATKQYRYQAIYDLVFY